MTATEKKLAYDRIKNGLTDSEKSYLLLLIEKTSEIAKSVSSGDIVNYPFLDEYNKEIKKILNLD